VYRNFVTQHHVDVEDLGREFGVLAAWEALANLLAIIKLCESGEAIGSAMALFRPMMDAIVRAEWLYFCADPLILQHWKNEFRFPGQKHKFEQLAAEVEEKVGDTDRFITHQKKGDSARHP
jgi:hypothetical protein